MAAHSEERKPLLLVDLNGTIIYRSETPVVNARPTLYIRGKYYYARPDAIEFLSSLSKSFRIAIYSSVMKHNITAFLSAMDKNWKDYISDVYDRSYNKPSPSPKREWDTVRDMSKILKVSGYTDKSFIVLDNESHKVQEMLGNAIIVPEFGPRQVRDGVCDLTGLRDYLINLAVTKPNDVKEYLAVFPWRYSGEAPVPEINIDWGTTMDFDRCENGTLFYKGNTGSDRYNVKLQNSRGTYLARVQLARLLELGSGEHFLYLNDKDYTYSMSDVLKFLANP